MSRLRRSRDTSRPTMKNNKATSPSTDGPELDGKTRTIIARPTATEMTPAKEIAKDTAGLDAPLADMDVSSSRRRHTAERANSAAGAAGRIVYCTARHHGDRERVRRQCLTLYVGYAKANGKRVIIIRPDGKVEDVPTEIVWGYALLRQRATQGAAECRADRRPGPTLIFPTVQAFNQRGRSPWRPPSGAVVMYTGLWPLNQLSRADPP
jgi:hypothetical protein